MSQIVVNGLSLPKLLTEMLTSGAWKAPSDKRVLSVLGISDTDDLKFFTVAEMEENSNDLRRLLTDGYGEVLGLYLGAAHVGPNGFLDVTRAVVIAATRGQEALCLDYSEGGEPRVVVTFDESPGIFWRVVADTFEQLVELLGLPRAQES
jgi:hypothetical protein